MPLLFPALFTGGKVSGHQSLPLTDALFYLPLRKTAFPDSLPAKIFRVSGIRDSDSRAANVSKEYLVLYKSNFR